MGRNPEIGKCVFQWVKVQRDLAARLQITPASLSAMLSGKVGLPLERFLQIVDILKPPKNEVDKVFNLYLDDINIPPRNMQIAFRGYFDGVENDTAREKAHRLIEQIDEDKIVALLPLLRIMKPDHN